MAISRVLILWAFHILFVHSSPCLANNDQQYKVYCTHTFCPYKNINISHIINNSGTMFESETPQDI